MAQPNYSFRYFPDYRVHARFDVSGQYLQGIYFFDPDVPREVVLEQLVTGTVRVEIPKHLQLALAASLQEQHPDASEAELDERVKRAVDELSRTPPVPWVQQNFWPVHHGDFARYIGEWDQTKLSAESADGNGRRYLMSIVREPERIGDVDKLWRDIGSGWTVIYVFECLTCGTRLAVDESY